jgi:hypothetical protein
MCCVLGYGIPQGTVMYKEKLDSGVSYFNNYQAWLLLLLPTLASHIEVWQMVRLEMHLVAPEHTDKYSKIPKSTTFGSI